jgi:hypothetical protein
MLWIADPNASPQDQSITLPNLFKWLLKKYPLPLASSASPYTLAAPFNSPFLVTTGASAFVFNLPAATGSGFQVEIKKVDSGAGAVQIAPNGSDVIDAAGNNSIYLGYRWQGVRLTDVAANVWEVQPIGKRTVVSATLSGVTLIDSLDTDFLFTGASTVTLPAKPFPGQRMTFKANTAATSVISANSGQTIGTTSSTSFSLYAQEDYVTLEWDGTGIWYVVATNGPIYKVIQTTSASLFLPGGWRILGDPSLGTLQPGVYNFELDLTVALMANSDSEIAFAIGNGTTPMVQRSCLASIVSGDSWYPLHLAERNYKLSSASVIRTLFFPNKEGLVGEVMFDSTRIVGQITAQRIG